MAIPIVGGPSWTELCKSVRDGTEVDFQTGPKPIRVIVRSVRFIEPGKYDLKGVKVRSGGSRRKKAADPDKTDVFRATYVLQGRKRTGFITFANTDIPVPAGCPTDTN
jgi:hypothetical protein